MPIRARESRQYLFQGRGCHPVIKTIFLTRFALLPDDGATGTYSDITRLKLIGESLKRLSDEFLTLSPERLSIVCIERISAYAFADGADGHVIRHDMADVAILAILAAHFVSPCNHSGPHRCCGSLRNRLPLKRPLTLCGELLIDLFDDFFDAARIDVAIQFRSNASRMHSCSPPTVAAVPLVGGTGEADVSRCGS